MENPLDTFIRASKESAERLQMATEAQCNAAEQEQTYQRLLEEFNQIPSYVERFKRAKQEGEQQ